MKNSESEISKPPRESAVSRVVASNPADEKSMLEYFQSISECQDKFGMEAEKTPEELALIVELNQKMKRFVEDYGGEWVEMAPENIHILDINKANEKEKEVINRMSLGGFFNLDKQAIFVVKNFPKLKFVGSLVHEMLHFNSFNSLNRSIDKKTDELVIKKRRSGLNVYIRGESEPYFNDLDEAVITELAIRFDWRHFADLEFIKEEFKNMEDFRRRLYMKGKKETADELEAVAVEVVGQSSSLYTATSIRRSYSDERKMLWTIINEIYKDNKDKFSNTEEIFGIFAGAVMSGKLLPVARLIEKTFGKKTFRTIGELTKFESLEKKSGQDKQKQ